MYNWSTLKKLIWLFQRIKGGAQAIIETITGTLPLVLQNAINHSILSLTRYGLCTQDGTPTPDAPVDIVTNNGALKIVDDELPAAYKRVLGFSCDNNAMWEITGFKLKGSDTVRISFSANAACNVWGCYQGTSATDNYDLYVSTTSGAKYFRYGSGTYLSYWSPDDLGKRFDVVYTPNGSQGMPQDSTWSPLTFTSANDLLIGSTTLTSTSAKLKGNIYGNFVVDGRLHLIPCERVSDGVLGYYDIYGATFYEPYEGFDGAVSLGYDGSHYSITADGAPEVLTVSADGAETQTASVPMLLSVGDVKDELELISGHADRAITVFRVSPDMNWALASGTGYKQFYTSDTQGQLKNSVSCMSNIAPYGCTASNRASYQFGCYTGSTGNLCFQMIGEASISTVADWKAFLRDNGVYVVAVKATETTEQTTAQHLVTHEGDNVVDSVANVGPVEAKVEYYATQTTPPLLGMMRTTEPQDEPEAAEPEESEESSEPEESEESSEPEESEESSEPEESEESSEPEESEESEEIRKE